MAESTDDVGLFPPESNSGSATKPGYSPSGIDDADEPGAWHPISSLFKRVLARLWPDDEP